MLGTILVVVLLAPLWIDPLTLATIRGSSATPAPGAQDTIEPADSKPRATDDPSLVWLELARDSFTRTVADGWGTAELGGAWHSSSDGLSSSVTGSNAVAAADFTVVGAMTLAGTNAHNEDVAFTFVVPSLAASADVGSGAILRRTAEGTAYLAEVLVSASGALSVGAQLIDASGAHALSLPDPLNEPLSTTGTLVRVRAQATGIDPTTIKIKAWPASQPEPGAWQYSVVDWTGVLQRTGAVGIAWHVTGPSAQPLHLHLAFDDFAAASADTGAHR